MEKAIMQIKSTLISSIAEAIAILKQDLALSVTNKAIAEKQKHILCELEKQAYHWIMICC